MNAPGPLLQEEDALASHHALEIDLNVRSFPPTDCDPGIRRYEMIARPLADECQFVPVLQLRNDLIGHDRSTQACSEHHYLCHDVLLGRSRFASEPEDWASCSAWSGSLVDI